MRGRIFQAVTLLIYGAVLFALVAAAPHQGIPPSPVIFTGTATADGQPAPEGTLLVACVDNLVCSPDHSDPDFLRDGDTVGAGGRFVALIAQGVTESQRGRATVHFFLIKRARAHQGPRDRHLRQQQCYGADIHAEPHLRRSPHP